MKLNRRKFFGFAGGAAVAAPKIAKDAVEHASNAADLDLQAMGIRMPDRPEGKAVDLDSEWGSLNYLRAVLTDEAVLESDALDYVETYRIDADIAALRSVSLPHKIEMQRKRSLERGIERARQRARIQLFGKLGSDAAVNFFLKTGKVL